MDPVAPGLNFDAPVFVSMLQEDRDTVAGFERALGEVEHVLEAQRLFGDPDRTSAPVMKHGVKDRPLAATRT